MISRAALSIALARRLLERIRQVAVRGERRQRALLRELRTQVDLPAEVSDDGVPRALLVLGLFYEVKKGALEWEK